MTNHSAGKPQTESGSEQKAKPLTPKELQDRLDLLKFGPTKPMPDPIDENSLKADRWLSFPSTAPKPIMQ
jgi:hypothetical protein